MLENRFKQKLVKELKILFPGCIVLHPDPSEIQGFPDLLILVGRTWFALEGKKTKTSSHRPNQSYWVEFLNKMCFASFISPETKEEVLNEIQRSFQKH